MDAPKNAPMPTFEQIAARMGCTPLQVRSLVCRNLNQLIEMWKRAEECEAQGKRYRGYSAEHLHKLAVRDKRRIEEFDARTKEASK